MTSGRPTKAAVVKRDGAPERFQAPFIGFGEHKVMCRAYGARRWLAPVLVPRLQRLVRQAGCSFLSVAKDR
jgi:hypothetical protein